MRHTTLQALAVTLAASMILTGCSQEDLGTAGQSRKVSMTVTASKGGGTRTELVENADGNLDCHWKSTDKLIVATLSGEKLGELPLVPDADNASVATFKGDIEYAGQERLNFIYPANCTSEADGSSTVSVATQTGTLAGLTDQDVLTATAEVSAFDGGAKADLGVMDRKIAFGRFSLSFPEDVNAAEAATITVSGIGVKTSATLSWSGDMDFAPSDVEGAVSISVADASADFFMAVIPGHGIEPTFSVTLSDGTSYTGTLSPRDWEKGEYVLKGNEDGSFSTLAVEMTKVGGEVVEGLPQGVGPVVSINGKKWQFVDGNLWYNVDTEQYGIYEKQSYYVYQFGKGVISKPNTYGSAYLGYDTIDHFSWGATGIGDYTQDPQTICKTGGTSTEKYEGTNYPFADQSVTSNMYFTNLLNTVSMDLKEADFGYAYMITGRHPSDDREYITPPQDAFIQAFGSAHVVQGCTLKGAGIDGSDVTGLIVIPNMTKSEAKAKITEIGGKYTSSIDNLIHNSQGNTFNVTAITLNSCEDLKLLNNALFFPSAGHGNPNAELELSGYTSFNKYPGAYWTADANQGSSTSANGRRLYFIHNGSIHAFFYSGSNTSSYSRHGKESVRLLVEVKE